jgi:hypothetical protein
MQGILTEKTTIAELEIETTQFMPMRAHKLLAKLARVLGPAIGEIGNVEFDKDGDVVNLNMESMGPALVGAFRELDDVQAEKLPLEILAGTSATGMIDGHHARIDLGNLDGFNQAFAGRGAAMYLAMGFALKVNYARFLEDLIALVPAKPAKESPSNGATNA